MVKFMLFMLQGRIDSILRSPKTMMLLADPRVQKAVMQLINLRGELRQRISGTVQSFARDYSIATREDMAKLRKTVRDMERTIQTLQNELASIQAKPEAETKAPPRKSPRTPASKSS